MNAREKWQAERDAYNAHIGYHHQHGECPDDGVTCESCCDHEDLDCGHCLDCGADRTEDLMARAYDRAKDRWKYGE